MQSNSLPGKPPPLRILLRSFNAFFALLRRLAGLGRQRHLLDDRLRDLRVLLQELAQMLRHHAGDDALDLQVVEPLLFLRIELRFRHLHADDDRQPFAEVLADRR